MENTLELFGLTTEQLEVMYSLEYLLAKHDLEENSSIKEYNTKRQWLTDWWSSLRKAELVGDRCYGFNEEAFVEYARQVSAKSFGKTYSKALAIIGCAKSADISSCP